MPTKMPRGSFKYDVYAEDAESDPHYPEPGKKIAQLQIPVEEFHRIKEAGPVEHDRAIIDLLAANGIDVELTGEADGDDFSIWLGVKGEPEGIFMFMDSRSRKRYIDYLDWASEQAYEHDLSALSKEVKKRTGLTLSRDEAEEFDRLSGQLTRYERTGGNPLWSLIGLAGTKRDKEFDRVVHLTHAAWHRRYRKEE